jgi:hypothetical protein
MQQIEALSVDCRQRHRASRLFVLVEVTSSASVEGRATATATARRAPRPGSGLRGTDVRRRVDPRAPGSFVDTDGAAKILGVTAQHVGRLAAQGRLAWLPTGRFRWSADAGLSAGADQGDRTCSWRAPTAFARLSITPGWRCTLGPQTQSPATRPSRRRGALRR